MSSHKHDVSAIEGAHVHGSGEVGFRTIVGAGGISSLAALGAPVFIVPRAASHQHGGSLLVSAHVHGVGGLGVIASSIPSTGTHGPSYLFNDLVLPDDENKEIRGSIEIPPVGVDEFFAWEDGSFSLRASPGTYSFTYRLFVNGMDFGTAVASILVPQVINIEPVGIGPGLVFGNSTFTRISPNHQNEVFRAFSRITKRVTFVSELERN